MKILALETTDKTGSVAALDDSNLLAELELDHSQRSAQSLAPAMEALLRQVGWTPNDVQLAAVSVGPGSFTGLRVGVTAAKVFAYAVGADILGINSLEAIALGGIEELSKSGNLDPLPMTITVAMDAQRGDLVVQTFSRQGPQSVEPLGPQRMVPAEKWLQELREGDVVTGPALVKWSDRLPPAVCAMERDRWFPRAAWVGRLAARDYAIGRRDDLWKLVPVYCRRSAAEEKLEAKLS